MESLAAFKSHICQKHDLINTVKIGRPDLRNRTTSLVFGLFLLSLLTLFFVAKSDSPKPSTGSSTNTIMFKALIDGADTVKIHGNKIWYEHESWELPGKSHGRDEPTIINGQKWRPRWKGNRNLAFSFAGWGVRLEIRPPSTDNRSTAFTGLKPAFHPQSPAKIQLTKITGRGDVTISQMPGPDNDQTLAIHFDDQSFMGADWYEVTIDWK
jgi:hypothetical protein